MFFFSTLSSALTTPSRPRCPQPSFGTSAYLLALAARSKAMGAKEKAKFNGKPLICLPFLCCVSILSKLANLAPLPPCLLQDDTGVHFFALADT